MNGLHEEESYVQRSDCKCETERNGRGERNEGKQEW